ncbi:MAG: hypothetical protein Kow0067_04130 [Coriobacteriia bacterium]
MRYTRFEWLVLTLGAAVIIGSMLLTPTGVLIYQEVIGQLLIVGVLVGAVHWGRDGGFLAAVAATLVYVVLRIPLMNEQGLSTPVLTMILTRVVTYIVVGIVGGEICGRIKYVFARVEGSAMIDEATSVYNARFVAASLKAAIGQYQRYQTPFAAAVLALSPTLLVDLRPVRQRSLLRSVAAHIRNDVRLVDDVGHVGHGQFFLLFPHTPRAGAEIAADRVRSGVRDLVGAKDESVTVTVYALPEDAEALCDLARELDPAREGGPSDPCEIGYEGPDRRQASAR